MLDDIHIAVRRFLTTHWKQDDSKWKKDADALLALSVRVQEVAAARTLPDGLKMVARRIALDMCGDGEVAAEFCRRLDAELEASSRTTEETLTRMVRAAGAKGRGRRDR